MYSRNVKIPTTWISSGIITPLSRAQSPGLCGSGVSQAFQQGQALIPHPTAACEVWMQDRAKGKTNGFSKRKKELLAPYR